MSTSPGSLLAAERQEPLLQFACCKKLDYGKRTRIVLAQAIGGILVQVAFLSVLAGLPLLLAALVLAWVVGFDDRADPRSFRSGAGWESCEFGRLRDIVEMDDRLRKWDESAFDISCGAGAALWVVLLIAIAVTSVLLGAMSTSLALIFAVDALLLLGTQWFNGMRTVSRQPDLTLQARHLDAVGSALTLDPAAGGVLGAQLLMRGEGETRVPSGAKLAVTFPDGPSHFLGLQAQTVINRVQGQAHPYCYAVLVARSGHGLLEASAGMELPDQVVRETDRKDGVDVVVVRQRTTKTSGYKTSPGRSREIVQAALRAAERYVQGS